MLWESHSEGLSMNCTHVEEMLACSLCLYTIYFWENDARMISKSFMRRTISKSSFHRLPRMLKIKNNGKQCERHCSRFLRADCVCLTESGPPVPLSLTQALSGAAWRSQLHFLFKVALSSLWHCWRLTLFLLTRPRSGSLQPRKYSFLLIKPKFFSP